MDPFKYSLAQTAFRKQPDMIDRPYYSGKSNIGVRSILASYCWPNASKTLQLGTLSILTPSLSCRIFFYKYFSSKSLILLSKP